MQWRLKQDTVRRCRGGYRRTRSAPCSPLLGLKNPR